MITPVGNSVNEFWNNIINGVCGLENLVGFDEFNCPVKVAGQIKNFNPTDYGVDAGTARRSDLYCQFALAAASQAMAESGIESGKNISPERLGVYGVPNRRDKHSDERGKNFMKRGLTGSLPYLSL